MARRPKGEVRDAIAAVLLRHPNGASVAEIQAGVEELIGKVSPASVRGSLSTFLYGGDSLSPHVRTVGSHFERIERGRYRLNADSWLRKSSSVRGRAWAPVDERLTWREDQQPLRVDPFRRLVLAAAELGLGISIEPLAEQRWRIGYLRGEQRVTLATGRTVENAAERALGALREVGQR